MTGLEALMWRLGRRDPSMVPWMRLHVGVEGSLDASAVGRRLKEVTVRVPRLRERARSSPLPMLPPRWEPDPDFDLRNHLLSATPGGPPGLDSPPWRAVLSDCSSLDLQLHHSYTDGLGGMRLLGELFDGPRSPLERPAASAGGPAASAGGASASAGGPSAGSSASAGRASASAGGPSAGSSASAIGPFDELVARSAGAIGGALRWATAALADPPSVPASRAGLLGGLWAGLLPGSWTGSWAELLPAGRPSPLLVRRSGADFHAALGVPLRRLRDTGRRLGATVNDVYLGGLLEGLARYHDKHLVSPPATIRLGVPMSTRPDGPIVEMSNHLDGALLTAPLGCLDFDERVRLLHEMVSVARSRRTVPPELLDDLAGLASAIPGTDLVAATLMRQVDVLASNLAGPGERLHLCGCEVCELIPYGPRSGAALNATLLSYAGTAFIGLNVDPASFVEPHVLVDCVKSVFEEVLE